MPIAVLLPKENITRVYTIINCTSDTLSNFNADLTEIDPFTYKDGVGLEDDELVALCVQPGIIVSNDLTGVSSATQIKRILGIASQNLSA